MERPTKTYEMEKEIPLPRRQVWDLLANTDHLNRLIGLFPIQYGGLHNNESLVYHEIHAKVAGVIPLKWKEYPFEWTKYRFYAVERLYTGGPLKRFYGGIELEDSGTVLPDGERATMVKLFAHFTAANPLGI
ncbi:MAG TPA: adenylate/guanylate cyclase domain-containing protein, partial [Bacillales bacterium]